MKLSPFQSFHQGIGLMLSEDPYIDLRKAPDARDLDLPHPALLDCHYRLAEILNAPGMADFIDHHLQDWENFKGICEVLREDGGTDVGFLLQAGLLGLVIG